MTEAGGLVWVRGGHIAPILHLAADLSWVLLVESILSRSTFHSYQAPP